MRHQSGYRKFQKSSAHTRAMFRNMATSLVLEERFETTLQKAKELRGIVEKLVTAARKDSVAARRQAGAYLMTPAAVRKLFVELAPRYQSRPGGYTRVIRTRHRAGDAAELAAIEFVADSATGAKAKSGAKKRKTRGVTPKSEAVKSETGGQTDQA